MPTITKAIGTSSRDYSTITLWEADLDDTGIYAASDDAVGECYNDSAFDESVTINGGGTVGLASITLTVPESERHDGTAGTGARIAGTARAISATSAIDLTVEWLEVDSNGGGTISSFLAASSNVPTYTVKGSIFHNNNGANSARGINIGSSHRKLNVLNSIVYDIMGDNAGGEAGIGINLLTVGTYNVLNNTVYDIRNETGGAGRDAAGIREYGISTATVKNNISMGISAPNGTARAFSFTDADADSDYNASDDTTADDSDPVSGNSLVSLTAADQFVSTTGGSEDLHLKSGADAIDAGTDLGTTPTGVNIDIDGYDRDAGGVTWDIGAHEFIAAGGGGAVWKSQRQRSRAILAR